MTSASTLSYTDYAFEWRDDALSEQETAVQTDDNEHGFQPSLDDL